MEDILEAVIVADSGENGCIHRQGDGGQGVALPLIAADQFRRQVLAVGGAASVPAEEYCTAVLKYFHRLFTQLLDFPENLSV